MVFFNWATMQMAAKIVYYGPGLCGKTTNLSHIYSKTAPGSRGEMVSLETETDRTLFFDLLPLEVGKVGGFRTRLQLYTVPGQVFYNTTRKLVLKGVDGIVFVADSQRPMADANIESLRNLEDNLRELGLDLDSLPLVLQYNKRDLKNILRVDELNEALNTGAGKEYFEAIAVQGDGVFETLKAITKSTLKSLRRRMAAQESAPALAAPAGGVVSPVRSFSPAALSAAAEQGLAASADREPVAALGNASADGGETTGAVTSGGHAGVAQASAQTRADSLPPSAEAAVVSFQAAEPAGEERAAGDEVLPEAEELPEATEVETQFEAPPEAGGVGREIAVEEEEASVEFATTATDDVTAPEPEVRHVKVSSSLDILAELENLRKAATSRADDWRRGISEPAFDLDSLLQSSLNSRQEVKRRIEENVGGALAQAQRCRVRIELVDGAGHRVKVVAPLDVELKSDEQIRQLSLTLTVNLHGE
jgi:signal recognition particle receptor subunit beta